MSPGDLAEALPVLAIPHDSPSIQIERWTADVLAFESCLPHADTDSLDDQVSL